MTARRAVLALAALLLALLAAELGARFLVLPNRSLVWRPLPPFGRDTPVQREWLERQRRELAGELPPRGYSEFDPLLGWRPRPASASGEGRVHVNSRGLRGTREYEPGIPAGRRRVVACGDSFTFCEEVADAEAWPAQLEALWPACEVLNLGCGGYGTDQALLRLRNADLGPVDAVVVGLLLENIGRNVNRYRPLWYPQAQPAAKPRYVLREELELVTQPFTTRAELVSAVESGSVLERLSEHEHWDDSSPPGWLAWSALTRLACMRRAYAAREIRLLWTDVGGEPFRTTLALLEGFRDTARDLGTEVVLVLIFPTGEDLAGLVATGERYWTTLTSELEARGLHHLDLGPLLADAERARRDADPPLYLESHLSPAGNAIAARAVQAWLEQRLAPGR